MPHSEEVEEMKAQLRSQANDFRIWTQIDGEWVSHFRAREFRSKATGLVLIHRILPRGLELVHRDLSILYQEPVEIIITNGGRMPLDIQRLVAAYGWVDEGGRVSRNSTHNILDWPGIASDIYARRAGNKTEEGRVLLGTLTDICWRHFDVVIGYPNSDWTREHAHTDQRSGGLKLCSRP